MKSNVFKNRKLIWFSIQSKLDDAVDLNDISIIGKTDSFPIEIIMFCHKKIKYKLPDKFNTVILYGGECRVTVKTFEDFEKELIKDHNLLSSIEDYEIIYDNQKFRKMIHSAKKKSNWPWIVKKILF